MAQKVTITLADDIDGSQASAAGAFGIEGTSYGIDLNEENAKALRDPLGRRRSVS